MPVAAVFLLSILSANDGKVTWLSAKSKNKGLQGTGIMVGGNLITLGVALVKLGSSTNSSNRSAKLCNLKEK